MYFSKIWRKKTNVTTFCVQLIFRRCEWCGPSYLRSRTWQKPLPNVPHREKLKTSLIFALHLPTSPMFSELVFEQLLFNIQTTMPFCCSKTEPQTRKSDRFAESTHLWMFRSVPPNRCFSWFFEEFRDEICIFLIFGHCDWCGPSYRLLT